ncbi:antirestriction protein [Agrobacterium sp. CNPSo 2736]|uniref:antirestriction protein n=1 Tax=Agrobacterium sp. CNPSo 2736 TaxID=2499627 RepID=UPI000FD7DC21|nr:antirestriction protein [Agrobacterium sp. CNPSo 2736]RVT74289.1 antirestriction protein [Agrobacterium sp. CNPSo 2736]
MSISELTPQTASIVSDDRRLEFLPTLFGRSLRIIGENAVYSLMEQLSPLDYRGGFWNFYEHEGKPLFLAPRTKTRFRITGEITGFVGEVSAEAAGIIATLFAFSHLSFQYQSAQLSEGYARLYAYSADHTEAAEIFQAID